MIGRYSIGEAFGFWVDGDLVPGSSLNKGDRIFAYRSRSKKPVEIFRKQAQEYPTMDLLVDSTRESLITVFDQFLRLSRCHRRRKR